jgi:hypothetical protein
MQENPVGFLFWHTGNWSYNSPVLKVPRPSGTFVQEAQETELMHVQFPYVATGSTSRGKAGIGYVACAAWPQNDATVTSSHAAQTVSIFAPFIEENTNRVFPGFGLCVHSKPPRVGVAVAFHLLQPPGSSRVIPCVEAIAWNAWSAVQSLLRSAENIVAGGRARVGRAVGVLLDTRRRGFFGWAASTRSGQREKKNLVKHGNACVRKPALLRFAAFHSERDGRGDAVLLNGVNGITRAVLGVVTS